MLQALLGPSPALYTQFDLLNAFSLFANPEGPSGCITYKALKDALVSVLTLGNWPLVLEQPLLQVFDCRSWRCFAGETLWKQDAEQ